VHGSGASESIVVVASASPVVTAEIRHNHGWDRVLYDQPAHCLTSAPAGREHIVVIDVPDRHRAQRAMAGMDAPDRDAGNRTGVTRSP
jgi:hypothetical protein